MHRHTISAKERKLGQIFCDEYLFSIPPYQRPYAWTTEEAGELLDDLLVAAGTGKPDERSPYFLGSIVLIKVADHPNADVVDGQQRLTTLTVLLAVLRDLASEEIGNDLDIFVCQRGNAISGTKDEFRLTLRERDKGFFETKIQNRNATVDKSEMSNLSDSQARIIENARLFRNRLESIDEKDRENLATYLIQNCYLVAVRASDADAAYRVFSVMNDRGLDLSATDILKAEIIGAIPENERSKYTDVWEELEEQLGRERFRDLFGHIRMIHRRQKMRGTLEAEFRKFVQPNEKPKDFIDNKLTEYAKAYLSVANQAFASEEHGKEINRYLQYLARLDNYDWEAPAVYFLAKTEDAGEVRRFIVDLERLAYSIFIRRVNINDRIKRYAELISAIKDSEDIYHEDSPLQLSQDEAGEVREKLDGPVYSVQRTRLPILLRLDEAVSEEVASYEHNVLSVEHVLPQTPADHSQWCEWFPDEEEREDWVHRLANLVLLSRRKNSQAQNFEFKRKKTEYFVRNGTTTFALTSQVLNHDDWTPETLKTRQKALLEKLCEVWRLEN